MSSAGSLDDLLDIRSALDRQGCFYVLIVGRMGEEHSYCWLNHQGNLDDKTLSHVHAVVDQAFEEEREEGT